MGLWERDGFCWRSHEGSAEVGGEAYWWEGDELLERGMRAGAGRRREGAHLEGLGVPVLDLVDGRHVAEVVGELVEFPYPVGKTNREFFCADVREQNGS